MAISACSIRAACALIVFALLGATAGAKTPSGVLQPVTPTPAFNQGRMGIFAEPLVAAESPTAQESRRLDHAIQAYRQVADKTDTAILETYLRENPISVHRASLWLNIGLARLSEGMDTSAGEALEVAWEASRGTSNANVLAVNQRAVAELLLLHTRLGHVDHVETWLKRVDPRDARGIASPAASVATMGLWDMRANPETAMQCGWISLRSLLHPDADDELPLPPQSPAKRGGFSLTELVQLAQSLDRNISAVRRNIAQPVPVPSVTHWRSGHFSYLAEVRDGRYLVRDPTLRSERWLSQTAFDAESSGFFLITEELAAANPLWTTVPRRTASRTRGAGYTNGPDTQGKPCRGRCCKPSCSGAGAGGSSSGMPTFDVNPMLIGVVLEDTPLAYAPPRGPSIKFTLTYNQKDIDQPTIFAHGNVGPKWAFNWIEYIQDNPASTGNNVMLYLPDGQGRNYTGYVAATQTFAREPQTGAILHRISTSPIVYERRLPDGSKEVFATSDGSMVSPRRIFLTQRIDAKGNAVSLSYDSAMRLVGITDALGQVSTIQYNGAASLLISEISDPFGRTATLSYDSNGRLSSITDAIGMTSSFGYGSGSTITSLTTPYGTAQFAYSESGSYSSGGYYRLDTTDMAGNVSRYEFRQQAPGIPSSESPRPCVSPATTCSMSVTNSYLNGRTSFYWDAHVYDLSPTTYTQARMHHWLHKGSTTADVLQGIKYPLERRIWYTYPGSSSSAHAGTLNKPTYVGRVLADNTTQLTYNEYNTQGNVTRTIDPAGLETVTTYDVNDIDPIQIARSGPDGYSSVETFTYDGNHNVLTHTDETGQIWTYTYNAAGQRLTATDPLNHVTTNAYDADGYLLSVTDANNQVQTSYTYDAIGRIATETDAAGTTKTYTYDALNRVTRIDYWDGSYEQNTWDKLDRVAHRNREGEITHYAYDGMRNLVSVTDPEGNVTSFTYYKNNLLHTRTDPDGSVTTWTRDIQGRVTAVEDPNGHLTTTAYDVTNRKTSETNALNQTTTYDYDVNDRLVRTQDANGVKTDRDYHPRGWLLSSTVRADLSGTQDPDDAVTAWTYDALGNPVSITDPDGVATVFAYDAAHRLTTVTDTMGNHLDYTLDAVGNRVAETTRDALNIPTRVLSRTFDARNLVATETDGLNQTTNYGYSPDRHRTSQIDRRGVETNWSFDAEGRLIMTVQDAGGNDPGTGDATTAFAYDAAGRLTEVTDPNGLATHYELDPMSRVEVLDSPDTGITAYTYDAAGNRLTQMDARAITATYSHDALNRITATTYPDSSQDVTYFYDQPDTTTGCSGSFPVGRLTRMIDASGSTIYCYDHRGNLTRKLLIQGNQTSTVGYTYTKGDRLATITYPNGGVIRYTRNTLGQIVTVSYGTDTGTRWLPIATNTAYRPFGPIQQITFAGGAGQTFFHDANDWTTAITGTALNLSFDHDAEGNIEGITEATQARSYDYDPLSRLTQVQDSGIQEAFTYDATGNRLSKTTPIGTQTYGYPPDSHHLTAIDSETRSYDAMGSLIEHGTRSFIYGDDQRLKQFRLGGIAQASYTHNGKGERVYKDTNLWAIGGGTLQYRYIYDEQGRLLAEYHQSGSLSTLRTLYVWLDERPVAVRSQVGSYANQWLHIHTDHLGTPRAITRPSLSNATIWRWNLTDTAFGEHAPDEDPDDDSEPFTFNLRYPGQYFDQESGLHYNYFRDYEPDTGRYIESDPIGLKGGISTYAYTSNRPLLFTDAYGLQSLERFNRCSKFKYGEYYNRKGGSDDDIVHLGLSRVSCGISLIQPPPEPAMDCAADA